MGFAATAYFEYTGAALGSAEYENSAYVQIFRCITHICIYVSIYLSVYMYQYIYLYIYMCINISMFRSISICLDQCNNTCIFVACIFVLSKSFGRRIWLPGNIPIFSRKYLLIVDLKIKNSSHGCLPILPDHTKTSRKHPVIMTFGGD